MDIKVLESDCTIENWVLLKLNIMPEAIIFFRCWDSARKAISKLKKIGVDYERAVIKMVVLSSGKALIMAGGKGYKKSITNKSFQALLKRISKTNLKTNLKRNNRKVIKIYPKPLEKLRVEVEEDKPQKKSKINFQSLSAKGC